MNERSPLPKSAPHSRVYTTMDFSKAGKTTGHFFLPHATNDSAEARIGIPMGIIANGFSPTVILISGTHGEEYESQIAVRQLFHSLDYKKIKGRIIFIPASNYPAVKNGSRLSPLDNGNLNGAFTNEPSRGPTYNFAHYMENALFPMADIVVDLHSGGKTNMYIPGVHIPLDEDCDRMKKLCELAIMFASTAKYIFNFKGDHSMFAAAKRQGTYVVGAELGGTLNPSSKGIEIGKHGVLNILSGLGILLSSAFQSTNDEITKSSTFLLVQGLATYGFAQHDGLFAHAVPLGSAVRKGQLAGKMHDFDLSKPRNYHFDSDGMLVNRRAITLSRVGECLWHLAKPVTVERGNIIENAPKISLLPYSYE